MLKLAIAAALTMGLSGAQPTDRLESSAERLAASAATPPAAAICVAGLNVAVGAGEKGLVRLSLSETAGRCGCPDACSLASLRIDMAGVTLHL